MHAAHHILKRVVLDTDFSAGSACLLKLDYADTCFSYNVGYHSSQIHYSRMSVNTIGNMERLADDSSNGMDLCYDVHATFDKLKVYFDGWSH